MRGLLLVLASAAMALPVLAGCLGDVGREANDEDAADPPAFAVAQYSGTCSVALLFEFIEYGQTDQYLPPGFHPRDPREFLSLPVALGQAGVIFLTLSCAGPNGDADFASVGIFVEPPTVEGIEGGLFDFYEVARYGAADPLRVALRPAEWPVHDAAVAVTLDLETEGEPRHALVTVTDGQGELARFEGLTPAPVEVGSGLVRYWHDAPAGLGLLEIDVALNAMVGGGTCEVRSGTELAAFLGGTQCAPPAEPIIGTFPALEIAATARFLPGVHAE